jgi:hypothetical protein
MSVHNKKLNSQVVLDLREVTQQPLRKRRFGLRKWLLGSIALMLIGAGVIAYLVIGSRHPVSGKSAMIQAVERVGKLMILPTDETPTYGSVSDATKLKDQVFFKASANGDEILIYQKNRLTILYRKSINKIVNVGPLIVGSAGSPYVTSRFAIKNGTNNPTLTDVMTLRLKQLYPNASIISSGPASRNYNTSIAIDLTKKNQPLDEQVADSLGIPAGKPPVGEAMPEGDILVIIGTDYK